MWADIKGILFDKDGTLIDFSDTWPSAFRASTDKIERLLDMPGLSHQLLRIGGQDPETDIVAPGTELAEGTTSGLVAEWLAEVDALSALSDHAGDVDLQDYLVDFLDQDWIEHGVANSAPVVELRPYFQSLKDMGLAIGIATNDVEYVARRTAEVHQATELVDFYAGYDSGHGAKPGPGMILAFCETVNLRPGQIVMIGDSVTDMGAGKAAGVAATIGVLTGPVPREVLAPHADEILNDISAIPGLIQAAR